MCDWAMLPQRPPCLLSAHARRHARRQQLAALQGRWGEMEAALAEEKAATEDARGAGAALEEQLGNLSQVGGCIQVLRYDGVVMQ